jgi:hypothetical protein
VAHGYGCEWLHSGNVLSSALGFANCGKGLFIIQADVIGTAS